MTLLPGTTVGRYQILEPLGQGGMATVYKAFQPSLQREVALKVLRPGYAQDAEFRERFEREAIAIAKLRHPHIVQVFDFEVAPSGEYVLAMEFLEGGSLKDRLATLLAQGRWIEPTESVRVIGEVAEALSYAHEKGIVHRDVKPSNVMLTHKDWAVVTDFGIARILGATAHTQTGVGIGTPEYMAPEQGQGASVDPRADIYSLGAMAYELLTGRVPYTADTPLAVVIAHIKDPLPLPSKVNPTIGPSVEKALLKALAKDREQRFDSATAFADALKAGLASDSKGGTLPTVVVRGAASAAATSVGAAATRGSVAAAAATAWRSRFSLPPVLSRHPVATGAAAGIAVLVIVGGVLAGNALRVAPAATRPPSTTAAVAVPSATPFASSSPSASAVPTLRTGPLLWSAPLDAAGSAFLPPDVGGDPAASKLVLSTGAIEIDALKIGGNTGVGTQRRVPPAFVGEVDLHVRAGSDMHFSFGFRNGSSPEEGGYALVLDTLANTLQVFRNVPASNGSTPLTAAVVVPGITSGRTVTLAVVAEPPRYRVYADDRLVTAFTDHALDAVASGLWVGGGDGSGGQVVVTGIRAYALPTGPQATPAPTIPPATASAAAVPPPTAAPAGTASIVGRLTFNGQPQSGVVIHADDSAFQPVASATTDPSGSFRIGGPAAGTYNVQIQLPAGFSSWSSSGGPPTVTVAAGQQAAAPALSLLKAVTGLRPSSFATVAAPLTLSWDALSEATSYSVSVLDDLSRTQVVGGNASSTSYAVSSLASGRRYHWFVYARSGSIEVGQGDAYFSTP